MKPITYSLQFRGSATEERPGVLRKHGSAPGCTLETSVGAEGLHSRFAWAPDEDEATFESLLSFIDDRAFTETGAIAIGRKHRLRLRGVGELVATANPELQQGAVVWIVEGGDGQFAGATGRITSNFLVSDTGELTDSQLGVVFCCLRDRSAEHRLETRRASPGSPAR